MPLRMVAMSQGYPRVQIVPGMDDDGGVPVVPLEEWDAYAVFVHIARHESEGSWRACPFAVNGIFRMSSIDRILSAVMLCF